MPVGPSGAVEAAVLSRTVVLSDAEIKALPTTPIVIVPATEVLNYSGLPTQLPLPIAFSVFVDVAAGAYGNVDAAAKYVLAIGSDWSSDGLESDLVQMAQLVSTIPQIGVVNSYNQDIVDSKILPLRINNNGLQDNALAIVISNGALGNLTGGNPANSMKATVLYTIINL